MLELHSTNMAAYKINLCRDVMWKHTIVVLTYAFIANIPLAKLSWLCCCGASEPEASEPEASERSSSLICAEKGFWTKFYLAHGIVVVRAFYAQNTKFKRARVFEFLSNF
jgi:hypothetical protein